jgi:hypothetical protein
MRAKYVFICRSQQYPARPVFACAVEILNVNESEAWIFHVDKSVERHPLFGVKRTWRESISISAKDPKRTFGRRHLVCLEPPMRRMRPTYPALLDPVGLSSGHVRDHPSAHSALRHAAAESSLYRRHTWQAAGGPGWTEEGRRHRGAQRLGPPAVVEASGMAATWSPRFTANWHGELSHQDLSNDGERNVTTIFL